MDKYQDKEASMDDYSHEKKLKSDGRFEAAKGKMANAENDFDHAHALKKDASYDAASREGGSFLSKHWGHNSSVEMKDQGSPLNYGMRGETKVERKMTDAENEQYGADKKSEQKRQYLKDAMAVAQTAGNIAGAVAKSDRRLKKDIKLISVSPSGINIYNFKYKDTNNGVGEFQGVMSDEIPYGAVVSHEDGFDRVDYSKIDVEFKAL